MIYLIRHGETAWSLSGQHTGRTELPLTPQGEQQASDLAPWLGRVLFAEVLTSPRQRARKTCALAGLGQNARLEPDLAEWDYGDYEGRTSPDICAERPGWAIFHDGCPQGETPFQVSARADRLIAALLPLAGNIALFSHGHFSRALAARWIGLPVVEAEHFSLGTAALGILGFSPDHPDIRVISVWNARSLSP
jgi:probable phosphoglycerate mutase